MPALNTPTLSGRLVELRPAEHAGPLSPRSVASWWTWRLEDMKLVGHAGLRYESGGTYSVGFYFLRRARAEGGYGAEVLRLVCRFAVERFAATKLLCTPPDLGRKAAAEEAGFRLARSSPPQHPERRRGIGGGAPGLETETPYRKPASGLWPPDTGAEAT